MCLDSFDRRIALQQKGQNPVIAPANQIRISIYFVLETIVHSFPLSSSLINLMNNSHVFLEVGLSLVTISTVTTLEIVGGGMGPLHMSGHAIRVKQTVAEVAFHLHHLTYK